MIRERFQSRQVMQRWLARARKEGVPDAYLGRRETLRYAWNVPVELVIGSGDGAKRVYATMWDISKEGLAIRCHEPISIGTTVRVYVEDPSSLKHYLDGIVDRCVDIVRGFKVVLHGI